MQASALTLSNRDAGEAHEGVIPFKVKAALYWTGFGLSIACTTHVFTTIGVTEGMQTMMAPILSFCFFGRKFLR